MLQHINDSDQQGFWFDVHFIRIVRNFTTEAGTVEEIGFVASDLAKALDMKDGFNATRGLDSDQKGPHKVRTIAGEQTVGVVSESGFYDVVVRSSKPEGKRLRSLVTREILPAIRKWGAYQVNPVEPVPAVAPAASAGPLPADIASFYNLAADRLEKLGVKAGIAQATAFVAIEKATGLPMGEMMKRLPPIDTDEPNLTPTNLGEMLIPEVSAKQVNKKLERAGLQYRTTRGAWMLTEAGQKHGAAFPYSRNGHTGFQIRWVVEVLDLLDS